MSFSRARAAIVAAVVSLSLAVVSDATAVGARTFVLDTLEKLSGGDLSGVAVSSDGSVRAGLTLSNVPIPDAGASFSALALTDGSMLVGTSPQGRIYKLVGETLSLFAETGALAVTSMVQAKNGAVFAATIPDGKVFKLVAGKAELFTTLPEASHVWALVLNRQNAGLFAATGPGGKVFRIEPTGANSVYYRTSESHLVSLAIAENGDLLAGSSGTGNLYRISGPGRATVLATLPGEEVKSIAVSKGMIWAIGNEYAEPPEPPKRTSATSRTPAGPASNTHAKAGKGVVYRFDAEGRPERMMKHDDTHYMSLAVDELGRAYVGTGADGRVYTVDDAHVVTLLADTDERQVGALVVAAGGGFVATSDPPVVHRIVGHGGPNAIWTSKVLDTSLRARFGTLTWRATGQLELSTRVGHTAVPDGTWTAWSPPLTSAGALPSATGRFVQVRARWTRDPNTVLSEVTLPFVTENLRPVVTEVSAIPKGAASKEPLAAGTIPPSGGDVGKHESVVKLSWKVDNPDSDSLRYRVAFKREGQTHWRDLLKPDEVQAKTEMDWDTAALPEGKYRIRVEASDESSNTPEQVQRHARESETVVVDNTPPRIETLEVNGRRLRAHVVDSTSPISQVEIAIDGKLEWRPLGPADGVFDTRDEHVDSEISSLVPPGSHIVVVRAFDAAGNASTRDIETR